DDFNVRTDVGIDNLAHGRSFRICRTNQPKIAVALPDADYHAGRNLGTPSPLLTTHVCLINLYRAAKRLRSYFLHRRADSVAKVPSGVVASMKRTLKLESRHTLLRFAHQKDSGEPLGQRQVGIMEDGSRGYGELIAA